MPSSTSTPEVLSEAQRAHFLEHGWVKVPECFTRAQADEFTGGNAIFTRLGMSPTDKATWHTERINMPYHNHVPVETFAPKAWRAMCELLGGEDRISENPKYRGWSDGFIVNLGTNDMNSDDELDLRGLDGWHNDGDFFVHFLDSPEQGLLVIPLWSDIVSKGGGTAICTDGMKHLAKHLYDHPEGTTPWMRSLNDPTHAAYEGREYWQQLAWDHEKCRDESFLEMTGETGDVILMHPLMLHSASKNLRRVPRIITNPPISLEEPFNFDREDPREYSLVEQKTLRDLGMPDGLKGWKITNDRRGWVSNRMRRQEQEKLREIERLKSL